MREIIDARGLACPQPVLRVKKSLEQFDEIEVLVDNPAALENIRRFAVSSGCVERFEKRPDGGFRISIVKSNVEPQVSGGEKKGSVNGPTVICLSADTMGRGDETLGDLLMKAFVHTLAELTPQPDVVVLYNTGIHLAKSGTQTAEDLRILSEKGLTILVCGTCVNYFGVQDQIHVGTISNMYDIADTLAQAGRIVSP